MDYRHKYIKIYFWQTLSVLLGFVSLFIVVPYISSNKTIYGIYSVCTSLTIFFSYADLGFLSSGVKYAAEYYIKGQHKEEIRIIGFTSFIMASVFAILALGIVVLGVYPKLLIPELLVGSQQMSIARWLLFTLAVSCPIIICQRLLNLIFTIRVEDYKFQRMNIIGNIIRILSVFFFFGNGRYMIVEYYIFYQFVTLLVMMSALFYVRGHYGYGIKDIIASFRFDKEIFDKVKNLTGTALIMTASSVLYYELDQVVISNVLGLNAVAVYAAALSVLQLVRSYSSIVYSPYTSRFNHFVGLEDYDGLTHFVRKMIIMFTPILVVPILTLSLTAEPFVISWVGEQYKESGLLVSFLVLCFIFNFIKEPIGSYFVATERNKVLIKYNIIIPVVFWLGVFLTVSYLNTLSFAIMKFVAPLLSVVAYWVLAYKDFSNRGFKFISISQLMKTLIPTIAIVFFFSWVFKHWMIEEHTKEALLINLIMMVFTALVSFLISIPFNDEIKQEIKHYWGAFKDKISN